MDDEEEQSTEPAVIVINVATYEERREAKLLRFDALLLFHSDFAVNEEKKVATMISEADFLKQSEILVEVSPSVRQCSYILLNQLC